MATSDRDLSACAARLEQMRAVTDPALAHMSVEDLLDALLDRVRGILAADTAAVLLLDPASGKLVATATKGLEAGVLPGTRVPVAGSFAGRVAVERRPVIVNDVARAEVPHRVVVGRGIRSLVGVPLVVGGKLLGVLHAGTRSSRRFTPGDVELVQIAGDRMALAVRALHYRAQRAGARELQRSLLPSTLPDLPGVELAARYSPGEASVGGDWYDVFTLPSGELCAVMGDVAGHGMRAAGIMGKMRSALRASALESTGPAEALVKLDRHMHHFEPDALATVLYAVCHPELKWAQVSSAGHFPPVMAVPGEPASLLDITPDVLIGLHGAAPRDSVTVDIPPGSLLCLYTDGLIERRDASITAGLDRLCEAVFLGPPEAVCAVVMAALVGSDRVDDDIALLTLRRTSLNEPRRPT